MGLDDMTISGQHGDMTYRGMTMDKFIETMYSRGFSAQFIRMMLGMRYSKSWIDVIGLERYYQITGDI